MKAVAVAGLVACSTLASITVGAQGSALFRGDAARTGVYDGPSPMQSAKVKWKFKTDGMIFSSPAVANGAVYFGSTDGFVYAVDAERGELRWKFRTQARVASSPAVVNGVVYVESYDSYFYAIDANTGQLKWKFSTEGERRFAGKRLHGGIPAGETMPDTWDFFLSSPVVVQNIVYFGSGDGNVYALDAASGQPRWKFHTGNVVHASPAIDNGVLFIGSWDRNFYALDAATGALRWKLATGADTVIHNQEGFQGSAAVSGGVVFVGCRDSHVYAIDARSGRIKWQVSAHGAWVSSSPSVRDGKVYVGTGDTGMLLILDAQTGKELLNRQAGWMIFGSPAVVGDMLYVGTLEGRFLAIDTKSGATTWSYQTDASKADLGKYTSADGKVIFRNFATESFYDDWSLRFSKIFALGSFLSSPVVFGGVIYVGSTDGNMYALH